MKYAVCEYIDGVLNDCMIFSEYDRAFNEYMKRFVYYFSMNGRVNPNLKIAYIYEDKIESFESLVFEHKDVDLEF